MPELILAGDGILKKRRLHGRQIIVRIARGIEDRLIGQIGGVQSELRGEPALHGRLLQQRDGNWSGAPGRLIEKPRRGLGRDLAECRRSQQRK